MDDGKSLLLAIDGGQTATKSLIARLDGQVLGAGLGGPSDHFHIQGGIEKNRRALHGAIDDVLDKTGSSVEQVVAVVAGLTGAPAGTDRQQMAVDIVQKHLPFSKTQVVPDYVTNLAGASSGKPGVVLIAGGGAIGYGVTVDGDQAIAGGFGYLMGDEGSAFWIGLQTIRAASKAADRRGEPTALEAIVVEHFQITKPRDLPWVVYAEGFSREQIALLAPKVVNVANEGDAAARNILQKAGEELGTLALGVLRQLFEPGTEVGVYLTGGVFHAGEPLMEPFRTTLHRGWPNAEPRQPRFPPAVGGLILAARSAGIEIDEPWLERVSRTLPVTLGISAQ